MRGARVRLELRDEATGATRVREGRVGRDRFLLPASDRHPATPPSGDLAHTPLPTLAIEQIKAGQWVASRAEASGRTAFRAVVQTSSVFRNWTGHSFRKAHPCYPPYPGATSCPSVHQNGVVTRDNDCGALARLVCRAGVPASGPLQAPFGTH